MNPWRFYLAQLKRAVMQPLHLAFLVLALALSLTLASWSAQRANQPLAIALVLEDDGISARRLVELVSRQESLAVTVMSRADAFAALDRDRLEAVFIIGADFSQNLADGRYKQLIERYAPPASQYTAAVSEPVLAGAMVLWTEQVILDLTRDAFAAGNTAYDPDIAAEHRQRMTAIWELDSRIIVSQIFFDPPGAGPKDIVQPDVPAPALSGAPVAVRLLTGWYAALSVFYLLASPAWILDLGRQSLRERAAQAHVATGRLIFLASLAPLTLCATGYLIAALAAIWLFQASWLLLIALLPAMMIYLLAVIGLTLVLAAGTRQVLVFLYAAPLITFVHAVLSGLLLPLPDWAAVLRDLSRLLPGRHLTAVLETSVALQSGAAGGFTASLSAWSGLLVAGAAWLGLGILLHSRSRGKRNIIR